MPLLSGKENISRNISELVHHGSIKRPMNQIVAIAMRKSRESGGPYIRKTAEIRRPGLRMPKV